MSYNIFRALTSAASGNAGSTRIGDDNNYSSVTPTAATVKGALKGIDNSLTAIISSSSGKALRDLSNLTTTAINTDLIAATNNKFLGSLAIPWLGAYINTLISTDGTNFETLRTDNRSIIDQSNHATMAWGGNWSSPTQANQGVTFLNQFRIGNFGDFNPSNGSMSGVDYVQLGKQTSSFPVFFNFPPDNGAFGYVLGTNGAGNTGWVPQTGGGGSNLLDIMTNLVTDPSLVNWVIQTSDQPVDTNSTSVTLRSGNVTGIGASGNVVISTGTAVNGNSGAITIGSANVSGTGTPGDLNLTPGTNSPSGPNGNVNISTGLTDTGSGKLNISVTQVNVTTTNGFIVNAGIPTFQNGTTGATLQVSGGTGAGQGGAIILGGSTGGFTGLRAPDSGVGGYFILPATFGTAGQFIQGNGSGGLTFATVVSAAANKETFVLSPTDITNGYVDLAFVAKTSSVITFVMGGPPGIEGSGYDYTVSYTGGAGGNTRIAFATGFTSGPGALVSGNVLQINYTH